MSRMSVFRRALRNWLPAVFVMAAIFFLSSRPSDALPVLGWGDALVKKGGHVLGYGALAVTYWRAMDWMPRRLRMAWLLALIYGITDELHQVLVPGRQASAWDVFLFDAPGAALGLWLANGALRRRARTHGGRTTRI